MPIILFLLLVILVAQVGFWDTLGAILGAAAVMALFVILLVAVAITAGYMILRRVRSRL